MEGEVCAGEGEGVLRREWCVGDWEGVRCAGEGEGVQGRGMVC